VDGNEDILEELDSGRNIILNSSLGYRYQKKQGDLITLELGKGPREYRIIGFINTLMEKGDYAMIAENYFKMNTGERNYGYIVMKTTNDPAAVVSLLKKKYIDNKPYVQSLNADKQDVIKTNQQIFSVLKGFSLMTKGKDLSVMKDPEASLLRRREIGFIFQFYNLIHNLTVEENIMLPVLLD
jgi:putative ABC transport system permease protein